MMQSPQSQRHGWIAARLGNHVTLTNGSAFRAEEWRPHGIPIVRIQNLKDRCAPFNFYNGPVDSKVVLKTGDLLFSWSGSRGTSFGPHVWWGSTALLNQHIFRVDVRDTASLNKMFLYFALLHLTSVIETHAYGLAALVHVRKRDLEDTQVPLPPLEEQQQIAAVLSAVQRTIERQERLVALTAELNKALMHRLFTEGTHGEPLKQTEIGLVPESWDIAPLGSLFSLNPTNGLYRPQTDYGRGTLILRIDDFSNDGDIVTTASTRVDVTDLDCARFGLAKGDIVLNRVNSLSHLGKTALVGNLDEPMLFESNMVSLRQRCVAPTRWPAADRLTR